MAKAPTTQRWFVLGTGGLKVPQVLAGFKADGLSRRDKNFTPGPWISTNAFLPGLDLKDTKAAQFDTLATLHGVLHGVENRLHRHHRLHFRDVGVTRHFVDDIRLNHFAILSRTDAKSHMHSNLEGSVKDTGGECQGMGKQPLPISGWLS